MSYMSHLVYRERFSNEDMDWADKLQFTVPDDIRQVELDFFPAGTLQTGAQNYMCVRINDVTSATYANSTKYRSNTSWLSSNTVDDTYWQVYTALTSGVNSGCTQMIFYPKKNDLGPDAYFQGHLQFNGATPQGFPMESRHLRMFDTTNRAETIEIFSVNSTVVSFGLEIRYVK